MYVSVFWPESGRIYICYALGFFLFYEYTSSTNIMHVVTMMLGLVTWHLLLWIYNFVPWGLEDLLIAKGRFTWGCVKCRFETEDSCHWSSGWFQEWNEKKQGLLTLSKQIHQSWCLMMVSIPLIIELWWICLSMSGMIVLNIQRSHW